MSVFDLTDYFAIRRSPGKKKPARKDHKAILGCEAFEERVVLSHMGARPFAIQGSFANRGSLVSTTSSTSSLRGADFAGALGDLGIVVSGSTGGCADVSGKLDKIISTTTDETLKTLLTNLKTASDQLAADLKTLVAKSEVTVADTSALLADAKAIRDAGVTLDATALKSVVKDIAYAVASGADLTEVKTAFTALFDGSSVSQETIDQTFEDLVTVIDHSNLTTADLDLIATDKAAVEAAKTALTDAGYDPVTPKAKPVSGISGIGKARRFRRGH